ncbi:MAG: hypothetical protein CM15mV42_0720 [uncultured marine virus]|nr:MAG: hypothetical protein CM15mV42_0720 [uncultured marine virus]
MLANSGGLTFLGSPSEVQEGRINNLKQLQKDVKYVKDDPNQSYTEAELSGIGVIQEVQMVTFMFNQVQVL